MASAAFRRVDPRTLTVLITGATSGFGEAAARRFVAEGSRVSTPMQHDATAHSNIGQCCLAIAFTGVFERSSSLSSPVGPWQVIVTGRREARLLALKQVRASRWDT